MTDQTVALPRRWSDHYLLLLLLVLGGYALLGKGFAYLGLPPFFVGELALIAGLTVLRPKGIIAALTTWPSLLLAVAMVWVIMRTVPYLEKWGFNALRDSVVIEYGLFAFIVICLLLEDDRRIGQIVNYYNSFLSVLVPVSPFLLAITFNLDKYLPNIPGQTIKVIDVRPGDAAIHAVGAVVLALGGFRKLKPGWMIFLLAIWLQAATINRGAMMATVVPIAFAMVMLGRVRQLAKCALIGAALIGAAYFVEEATIGHQKVNDSISRSVSAHQLIENIASTLGIFADRQTEGTKQWRMKWWDIIVDDTINGPNFWSGRGFGLNVSDADGVTSWSHERAPTRSPHNVFMTLLARAGVPGVVLFTLILISWSSLLMKANYIARHRGHTEWANLFVLIVCYEMSILINASFDVALEGPMQGIWFWCMYGFGIGSVMVFRAQTVGGIGSSGR